MGLQLPEKLADLLNELGYTWPKADEVELFRLGRSWQEFASTAERTVTAAGEAVAGLAEGNSGTAMDAFWGRWNEQDGGVAVLEDAITGATVLGGAVIVCAGVVLALKTSVIIQLTILAAQILQAILTAAATYGASLAEIPVFKKLADIAINLLISQAVEAIVG